MKRRRAVEREVVVIGGGLVGLMTALLVATETNFDVCVYADDSPEPRTDSQRNHAWLQSGLLYVGADVVSARHMYAAGRAMHQMLSIRPPTERGVFRYASEEAAQGFLEHAKGIALDGEVKRLKEDQAKALLGSFFEEKCANYEVPDCPFDIAGLMNAAREQARASGASFRVDRVEVKAAPAAPNGYQLQTSGELIEPRYTVVGAGSWTPAILESLGLPHPLVINRSGLLVLPRADSMSAPLLADRSRDLSFVRHVSIPPRGRLVVGDKGRAPVQSRDGLHRRLTRAERESLLSCLPANVVSAAGRIRATACHKTDRRREKDGKATVEPWVETYPQFPGMVFATPGKATMALYTAEQIVGNLGKAERKRKGANSQSYYSSINGLPKGRDWRDPIRTHFHPDFDGLDDTESEVAYEKAKNDEETE